MRTTKEEKAHFITECLDTVGKKIMENIDKMPENWDGWELRQYIGDIVNQEIVYMKMDKRRMKEYENTRLANNL